MDAHPLISWYASLKRSGGASFEGTDIVLTEIGGKRFGLGIEGVEPVLYHLKKDGEALKSIGWTSAAIVFGHRDRDWIALSCKDIRIPDSAEMNPVPLRLWIPVTTGRLDAWKEAPPKKIHLGVMTVKKKGPPSRDGGPLIELPVKLIG